MDKITYPNSIDNIELLDEINTISDLIMIENNKIWNYNEPFIITISTDSYGDNFTLEDGYIEFGDNIYLSDIEHSFEEIINDIDSSTNFTGSFPKGTREVDVKDNIFDVNDVVNIKDKLYKLTKINDNTLKLDRGLEDDVDSSDNISLSGNTGIYKLIINHKTDSSNNFDIPLNTLININLSFLDFEESINKTFICLYTNRFINTLIKGVI